MDKKQKLEVKYYQGQIDKLKIALIEYDRHVREKNLVETEILIQQLDTENAHLRKMLNNKGLEVDGSREMMIVRLEEITNASNETQTSKLYCDKANRVVLSWYMNGMITCIRLHTIS